MSNLTLVSDSELLLKIQSCVADERRAISEVLRHLSEVDSRRLFPARSFSSLFEFTVKYLSYSEGAAWRRIGAMRLLYSLPESEKFEIESALNLGQVSLSTLSSVQSFCRAEKLSTSEKSDLIKKTLGKTQRETDRMLAALSPDSFRLEKTRPLSDTLTELRITLTNEQMAKLERAREILSNQAQSWAEVFEKMAEQMIKKSEPKVRDLKKAAPSENLDATSAPKVSAHGYSPLTSAPKVTSRYISRPLKRQKFTAAQHQCEYIDSDSGRRCSAREHLEIDHIRPLALGGKTIAANLRVLCRTHNHFEAIKSFGIAHIERKIAGNVHSG